jgi:anthranilate synthase component 1
MKFSLNLKIKPQVRQLKLKSFPITVYERLYQSEPYSFIYESLEEKDKRGRYSFIGARPFIIFKSKGEKIEIIFKDNCYLQRGNPIETLRGLINQYKDYPLLVPFSGGAVGYVAYDVVRFFEKIPDNNSDPLNIPEIFFIFPGEIIIFDHKEEVIDIIVYSEGNSNRRIKELTEIIKTCPPEDITISLNLVTVPSFRSNFTQAAYYKIVNQAKEYIFAGDIFQVVLSQRFTFHLPTTPYNVFKSLRITNPSPYMYYLSLDGLFIAGSSPETLVKLQERQVTIRPLAGTRARGKTTEEDKRLQRELLNDEKEKAEHIMLVDLARNDIGRVCEPGSIKTTELLEIERYSKVMHIVSNVTGKLSKNCDAFDLLAATFPAGTVSGAPKIRAMEIIDQLEPVKRGIYAGAIGYFAFSGDMDMCIAIRTIVIKDKIGYIQTGAGIVADSEPAKEYQETLNKAIALKNALKLR